MNMARKIDALSYVLGEKDIVNLHGMWDHLLIFNADCIYGALITHSGTRGLPGLQIPLTTMLLHAPACVLWSRLLRNAVVYEF